VFLIPAVAALVGAIVLFWGNPRTHVISEFTAFDGTRCVGEASPEASAMLIGFWVLVAGSMALLVAVIYRATFRFRIRRQFATRHPHQIADVLLPLRSERGDTRKILAPLLRQFGIPRELAPAAAPDARGDEASTAEHPDGASLEQ
jgi:hypothetical protein